MAWSSANTHVTLLVPASLVQCSCVSLLRIGCLPSTPYIARTSSTRLLSPLRRRPSSRAARPSAILRPSEPERASARPLCTELGPSHSGASAGLLTRREPCPNGVVDPTQHLQNEYT